MLASAFPLWPSPVHSPQYTSYHVSPLLKKLHGPHFSWDKGQGPYPAPFSSWATLLFAQPLWSSSGVQVLCALSRPGVFVDAIPLLGQFHAILPLPLPLS